MQTAIRFSVLLHIAILAVGVLTHEHEHDEQHDDASLGIDFIESHGHSHGAQLPVGYVKYPWQSPQTHVTYPGDDEGLKLSFLYFTIGVACSIYFVQ